MRPVTIAALAGCAALAACVSFYKDVDESAPHATVQFVKGYKTGASAGLGYSQATNQEYAISDDAACANTRRIAFYNFLNSDAEPESRRVAADRPAILSASTHFSSTNTSPGGVTGEGVEVVTERRWIYCDARATFTPEAGRTYRATHEELEIGVCELHVVDAATGAPPPDLVVDNKTACLTSPHVEGDA